MSTHIELNNTHGTKVKLINSDTNNLGPTTVDVDVLGLREGSLTTVSTIDSFRVMTDTPDKVYVEAYFDEIDDPSRATVGAFGSNFFKLMGGVVPDGSYNNDGTIIETVNGVYELQYEGAVNIKWFGAVGDGIIGDSAAIQSAFNSEANEIVVPNVEKYYMVKDLILPYGKTLRGIGRVDVYNPYTSVSEIEGTCCLVYDTTGTSFIKYSGKNIVSDINFYGTDKSVPMCANNSGAGNSFTNVSSFKFSVGFGNTTTYFNTTWLTHCHAAQNTRGIAGLVDSHVHFCEVNANQGSGIYQPAGSNDTQFTENKVEWNEGYGYQFYSVTSNSITGGICDRNYIGGVECKLATINVTGGVFRRNGKSDSFTGSHFYLESGVLHLSNVVTAVGADDDGAGDTTPNYIVKIGGATANSQLVLSNNDLTGYVTAVYNTTGSDPLITNNVGVDDLPITDINPILGTGAYQIESDGTASATMSVSGMPSIAQYSRGNTYIIDMVVRNKTNLSQYYAQFFVTIGNEGSASVKSLLKSMGTDGIETSGGTIINVSVSNVASDGTTFDVIFDAISSNTLNFGAQVTKGFVI